jgi:hypothetical protein
MLTKIAAIGGAAAIIAGLGGAAIAESGSGSANGSGSVATTTSATTSSAAAAHHRRPLVRLGRHVVRGQVVTRSKDGTFVTHDVIRGKVSAVSATSIAVKAADGTAETYAVNSTTKVRQRANGKGTTISIQQVKTGANVLVIGVGTHTLTARRVIELP